MVILKNKIFRPKISCLDVVKLAFSCKAVKLEKLYPYFLIASEVTPGVKMGIPYFFYIQNYDLKSVLCNIIPICYVASNLTVISSNKAKSPSGRYTPKQCQQWVSSRSNRHSSWVFVSNFFHASWLQFFL